MQFQTPETKGKTGTNTDIHARLTRLKKTYYSSDINQYSATDQDSSVNTRKIKEPNN